MASVLVTNGPLGIDRFCHHRLTDSPLFFGQTTPYNSFKALMLLGRKGRGTPAYILRKLVSVGKGVPNAFRIAACRSSGVGKRTTAVPWMW